MYECDMTVNKPNFHGILDNKIILFYSILFYSIHKYIHTNIHT